jgi:tRNA(fMet)-specific endonuclease VapC
MNDYLFDTDIISYFLKGNEMIAKNMAAYLKQSNSTSLKISLITYYEILSGLRFKQASGQLSKFIANKPMFNILALTEKTIDASANFYAETKQLGKSVDDIDLLIAGVAKANNLILVTNNEKHFSQIPSFALQNWSTGFYF